MSSNADAGPPGWASATWLRWLSDPQEQPTPDPPQCTDCFEFLQHRTQAERAACHSVELKKERLCRLGESKHQLNIDPDNPQCCTTGKSHWSLLELVLTFAMASSVSATRMQRHMLLLAMFRSPLATLSARYYDCN